MKFKVFSAVSAALISLVVICCSFSAFASQNTAVNSTEIKSVSSIETKAENSSLKIGKGEKVPDFIDVSEYTKAVSDNDSVCSVNEKFEIYGVKEGTAVISVYSGESVAYKINVTVCKEASFIINYSDEMAVGQEQKIQVVFDKNTYSRFAEFSSSNNSVLSVSKDGIVTAKKTGSAKVTYTAYTGESQSANITVKEMPKDLSVSATQKTLTEGQSFNMNGRVESSAYQTAVFYSTTDRYVASVSSSGKVTAVGEGKAVITAYTDNGLRRTCVVYVYGKNSISLNQNATRISMDYSNVTKIVYGKSVMGKNLEAFVINGGGNNSKTIFCTFAVHGFEDAYSKDGKLLVSAGNYAVEYFAKNPDMLKNYRIVIVPCANPDGTIDGKNNLRESSSAFGRCTAAHVDMNRDFISGSFKAQESRALRDLMYDYKMSVYIDFHGWLNTVLGDSSLVNIFRSTAGLSRDQSGSYGTSQGYIIGWVKEHLGAKSALVEFKSPGSLTNSSVINGLTRVASGAINRPDSIEFEYSSSIPAVKNVVCTSKTDYSVTLKWNEVSGAGGYQAEVYKDGKWQTAPAVFHTNQCTITGLDSGKEYKFRVRAFNISGYVRTYSTNYSDDFVCRVMPHKVYGLTVVGKSYDATQIRLKWTPQLDADGYCVFVQYNGAWSLCDVVEGGASSYYSFCNAVPSTPYNFRITAYSGDVSNHSYASDVVYTYSACPPMETPPVATTLSETKINVKWETLKCDGYVVEWSTSSDFSTNVNWIYIDSGNTDSYTFSVDNQSYNYYVKVRAWSDINSTMVYGAWSQAVKPIVDKAYKVTGLTTAGRGEGGTKIRLSWDAQNGVDNYNVYQIIGGRYTLVGTANENEFNVSNLNPSWEYYFRVSAVKDGKEGEKSNELHTVAACAPVQNFAAYATDENTIKLSWTPGVCHGYFVQWSTDPTFSSDVQSKNLVSNSWDSYTISTSDISTKYYVRIRAWRNWNGGYVYGDFSKSINAEIINPLKVTGLVTAGRGDGGSRIRLGWDKQNGADGYNVYQMISGKYVLIGTTKENDFNVTDLNPSWEYYFRVTAVKNGKEGNPSDDLHTVAACAPVKDLKVTSENDDTIKLSWTKGVCHGYYIEWSTDPSFKADVQVQNIVNSTLSSYTINVDGNAGDYYVRIRAWRNWDGGYVFGDFTEAVAVTAKVTGLVTAGRGEGGTRIRLSWNVQNNADSYNVYQKIDGEYQLIGTTETNDFNVTGLNAGWEYYFKVSAVKNETEGALSDELHTVAACAPVADLTVTATDESTITLNWTKGVCHGYFIQWSTDPTFKTDVHNKNIAYSQLDSYTINLDGKAEDYYVRIRAWRNWDGGYVYGDFSQPLTPQAEL